MLQSAFLKIIVVGLTASTAGIVNAQSYNLLCNGNVQNPAGCLDYGYCSAGGFFMSCGGPATDCQAGHTFCLENCRCVRV